MYSSETDITKNFSELQADILTEDTAQNSKMPAAKTVKRNKALKTSNKTIVNAINELLASQEKIQEKTSQSLKDIYDILGNFAVNPSLKNELTSRGAETVLELASKTYDALQAIKDLVQDDYEDMYHIAEGQTQSEFVLTHKPVGKLRIYVDGIRYFSDCIEYDSETNTVKWVNDSSKPEGFDITDADVVIEYDYKKEL